MKILIHHETKYEYDRLVYLTPHILRLKPAAHSKMSIESFSLVVKPENNFTHSYQDPFGNFLTRVDFKEPMQELLIKVNILANTTSINPFDFLIDESAQYFPFEYDALLKKGLSPYLEVTDNGPELMNWLSKIDRSKQEMVSFLMMLNQRVFKEISYNIRMEPGVQTCEISLLKASGSCRDTAWLLVQIFRHLGFAARFVSGYLVQLNNEDLSDIPQEDSVALHAWTEVYIPGAGWIGLDSTSGQLAGEGYIPLACTPDPDSAAPITGTSEMSKINFTYISTVTRVGNHSSL